MLSESHDSFGRVYLQNILSTMHLELSTFAMSLRARRRRIAQIAPGLTPPLHLLVTRRAMRTVLRISFFPAPLRQNAAKSTPVPICCITTRLRKHMPLGRLDCTY